MQEKIRIERLRAGDAGSFRELVERYQHRVYAMAYRFSGCSHEAKDLAQDIFLRVYENIGGFQGRSSLDTWIYRLALNQCISWKRRRGRRAVLGRDGPVYGVEAGEPPDMRLAAVEENECLHRALRQLPVKYMSVVELYYFQELSYQQIAELTGIAVRTVETRLYRAKQRLRELLGPDENGEEEQDHGRYENAACR
jgi:RNA polymerase sigma-70 factor (ECF subfamily)